MALLTVQKPNTVLGTVVSLAAATARAGGDTYPNSGKEFVVVANAGVGAVVVTCTAVHACDVGAVLHAIAITVAAGVTRYLGPFEPRYFATDGITKVTFDQVVTVTVGVLAAT